MKIEKTVIAAFSEDQTSRLTGVSKSQLRYWDKTDFFVPSFAGEDRGAPFSRLYSFQDIVSLKVLDTIRNKYKVPLSHMRDVRQHISAKQKNNWTGMKLWVVKKRLVWEEPTSKRLQEILSGQHVSPVLIGEIVQELKTKISELNTREASKHGQIGQNRYIQHNAPVVAGTRIPVVAIKRFASAGYSAPQIQREYPDLTLDDIRAALAHEQIRAAA